MKNYFKYYKVLLAGCFTVFALNGFAQCDPQIDPGCEDIDVPLDGGVSLLLAAGACYGAYKLKRKNKEGEEKNI